MKKIAMLLLLACAAAMSLAPGAQGQNMNGVAGSMPAYYDGQLFTINFKELSASAEAAQLAHNQSINTIYQSDAGLPGGQPFISVLDAIQGDGFNPLWVEVQITFTAGNTPRQLFSDTAIDSAVANGEITLQNTGEVYRCSVIGANRGSAPAPSSTRAAAGPLPAEAVQLTWGAMKEAYR